MNVSKTNGVKLLATVMVLAMVFAGAAVMLSDESVDAATTSTPTAATEYKEGVSPSGALYVSSTTEIDIGSTSGLTFYIANGVELTLKGSATATVSAAESWNGTQASVIDDLSVNVTATADGVKISNSNGALTSTTIATEYGILVQDNTTYTAYGSGAVISETITYTSGEINQITVKSGTATINQGRNTVVVEATGATGITVAAGDPYPVLGGTGVQNNATVTISGGFFTGSVTTAVINGVKVTATSEYFTNQIVDKVGTVDVTAAEINGTVTQSGQVGSAKILDSESTVTGIDVTFATGGVLTINNNVNVYVNDITGTNGTVNLFGALYSVTEADDVEGKIGPSGYYNEKITFTGTNTNVISGDDSYISGEFSGSPAGDFIIADDGTNLTIPEGTTFTITGNLGLNGQKLIVKGTLVIENRATIFGTNNTTDAEGIYIQGKGTIQNNGTIGKMIPVTVYYDSDKDLAAEAPSITMQGVSGVSYSIDRDNNMTVSGAVSAATGAKYSKLTINGVYIGGDFSTAKKVALELGSEITISKNAKVVLNGDVAGAFAMDLKEGASITVNGTIADDITASVGLLEDSTTLDSENEGTITLTPGKVTGYTLYIAKVGVANENTNKTDYYLRAYVNGSLATDEKTDQTISIDSSSADFPVYIAAEETLTAGENVALEMENVVIEGTIVITNDAGTQNIDPYVGATYSVVTGEGTAEETTTVYYTTLAAAMSAIDTADDKAVTAYIEDLEYNVTVKADQNLELNLTGTIAQDAILTVENEGVLTGSIAKVDGKMIVQVNADAVVPLEYDVMSTAADETVTYAGIAIAIAEAQPGDKIAVGNAEIGSADSTTKHSLTIPQGVEVTVTGTLTIYGDLTVANEATLIGGTVNMARPDSKVTVNGTLDLTETNGMFTGMANFILTSTGNTVLTSTANLSFSGAYYSNADGEFVITNVANAVAYATENQTDGFRINGKVTETADLVLDGVDVTLDADAEVVLGNVTLTDATITSTGAKLTAVVTGMNGEGDAAVNGTISVNKSAIVIDAAQVVNAAGTTVYTYTINAIDGTMTVQSGIVVLKGNVNMTGESKFTVASGATLLVGKETELTVNGGDKTEFTVDGTLDVDAGTVTFTAGKSVINGTVDISGNGTVKAAALVINGTVNVSAVENDEGTFTVTNNGVTVGDAKEALGSTGSIVGIIGFDDDGKYIIAYAGTDMSGAKLANDAEFETTAFYVNDALYATVYAEATGVVTPIDSTKVSEIPGIDKAQVSKITWATADGTDITTNFDKVTIGQYEAVYAKAPLDQIKIKVSVGTGISLYVDNVKIVSETYDLTIGTHTVSATVNPGYAGEVTISFNGQTVTGGSIEITVDSEGVVLSALGDISVDTGSSGSSDGMGLTEILLVILVILIVVMAIMVALRLMRS